MHISFQWPDKSPTKRLRYLSKQQKWPMHGRLIVDINAMCRYIPPNLSTSKVGDKHDFFQNKFGIILFHR